MSHQSELIASDIDAYLAEHERKDLLRFLTCGSVDDGKSTLIGRLLHDSKMIYEDQLAAIEADSTRVGNAGDHVDLALLTDGLKAEREQGITIDVAYRYFSTAARKFIIADTPGHEQYTRNMVTGASTCQMAVILVDARHGVITQTKRHSYIANLLGIKHIAVAINKMDLVDWSQSRFDEIVAEYQAFAGPLDWVEPVFMPISALMGDNVVDKGDNLDWFDGPTIMEHLETVDVSIKADEERLRFPVQMVSRPNLDFRGFAGTIASGSVRPGDEVMTLPSRKTSTVERIVTFDGDLDAAGPGQAVTLTLADEIDSSRGDLIVHADDASALSGNELDVTLVWMAEEPLAKGHEYVLQSASGTANAQVADIHYRIDINTLERQAANELGLNDIASCRISADRSLLFDRYDDNRTTGALILVDKLTNATVASGMIRGAVSTWDRSVNTDLQTQLSPISSKERSIRFGQQPATVLLTGLTGAGKSTLATALERELFDRGKVAVRLDGENMRMGISHDLGFDAESRSENIRRAAEVARLLAKQGVVTIGAFAAPDADVRAKFRDLLVPHSFVEVYLNPPLEVCRERDTRELYARAEAGEIEDFPGVSYNYDNTETWDLELDTDALSIEDCLAKIVAELTSRGVLRG